MIVALKVLRKCHSTFLLLSATLWCFCGRARPMRELERRKGLTVCTSSLEGKKRSEITGCSHDRHWNTSSGHAELCCRSRMYSPYVMVSRNSVRRINHMPVREQFSDGSISMDQDFASGGISISISTLMPVRSSVQQASACTKDTVPMREEHVADDVASRVHTFRRDAPPARGRDVVHVRACMYVR
jgi:hypothetical protein